MSRYFEYEFSDQSFSLFSSTHIGALVAILIFNSLIIIFRNYLKKGKVNKIFRRILSITLFAIELLRQIWYIAVGAWSSDFMLPLDLCTMSQFLCAIMLWNKNYAIYEIVWFWGMGGAVQALITPDIVGFDFPHFVFIQFFAAHGLIVAACIYMTFVEGCHPILTSIPKALLAVNLAAIAAATVNIITGANYMYLRYKPINGSLLDFLGPWPWYIVSLEFVALILFFLLYLPFAQKTHEIVRKILRLIRTRSHSHQSAKLLDVTAKTAGIAGEPIDKIKDEEKLVFSGHGKKT